jgi:hypothetical protein
MTPEKSGRYHVMWHNIYRNGAQPVDYVPNAARFKPLQPKKLNLKLKRMRL